ncbi:MAG: site-specific integrase [Candidatus Eisenbacteria bacterium]|nr:site-specific integrase [Candidatus Eisenbacteria bacterium]
MLGVKTPLGEITAQRIDGYVDERKTTYTCPVHRSNDPERRREPCLPRSCAKRVTDSTIHKEMQVLQWTLTLAKRRGEYGGDPSIASHSAKYIPRQRWLKVDEAEALYARIRERFGEDRAAHFAFFLGTGSRLSEARRARSTDVQTRNVNDACVTVVHLHGTKTRKANRVVIVTTVVGPWLERALEHAPGQGSDPLFHSWPNLQRDIRGACADLGIPAAGPNDLRRTFASWHLHAGVERSLVAAMLGHTSTAMLDRVYGVHTVDTRAALMTEFLWHAPASTPGAPSVTKASASVIDLDAERHRRRG